MLFDTHLRKIVLFCGGDIAALQPAGWVAIECTDFRVDNRNRIIAHDSATRETLAVCLERRTVFRFDTAKCQHLCDFPRAGEFVDFVSTNAERPLAADWLIDPEQHLTLFVDNDLGESYRLGLGPMFNAAAARSDRTALHESKAHLLPSELEPVVNQAVHAVLGAIRGDVVERLTGLPARYASEGMLRTVARKLWGEVGPGAVGEFCEKAGVDLVALGFSVKDCEPMFLTLAIAAFKSSDDDATAAAKSSRIDVCQPVRWQNFGPERPAATIAAPPVSDGPYVLAFDSTEGCLTYIRSQGRSRWGQRWHWNGSSWECAKSKVIKTISLGQRFRAVDDPVRGGIVCWSTDREYKKDRYAFGVLVTSSGVSTIASKGEIPKLAYKQAQNNGHELLFAFDPSREKTVAISSEALWDLDGGGVWSKRCTWGLDNPLARKWADSKMADAGWDAINGRVVLWFPDEGGQFHFVAVANDQLIEISTSSLPVDLVRFEPPIVGACGELGIIVHTGASTGTFALGAEGWTSIKTDNDPPRARDCHAAYDPGRRTLMFGPGEYRSTNSKRDIAQHVFNARQGGRWQLHGSLQPSRERPFHIESFAAEDGHMVGLDRGNKLFHWTETSAWVGSPDPGWTAWEENVVNGFGDAGGRLTVITTAGGVYRLVNGAWETRTVDRAGFEKDVDPASAHARFDKMRFSLAVAYDRDNDRWLAFDLEKKLDTLLLSGDAWKKLDAEPEPFNDSQLNGEFTLAYDGFLHCFIRVHPNALFALKDGIWRKLAVSPKDAGLTGHVLRAVHDPTTKETLIVDFATQRIARFALDKVTYLTSYELPEDFEEPRLRLEAEEFPFTTECPFDHAGRRLLVFDPSDHYGNFQLDLSTVFDAASALAPRTKTAL